MRPIKAWHGRVLAPRTERLPDNTVVVEEVHHIAPLVSTKKKSAVQSGKLSVMATSIFYPIRTRKEALRRALFTYSDARMKDLIVRCIMWIQNFQFKNQTVPMSADEIKGFLKTRNERISKFSAASVRTVSGKRQHTKNFSFCLLCYGTARAPRGKQTDLALERSRQRRMRETYKKLFNIRCAG